MALKTAAQGLVSFALDLFGKIREAHGAAPRNVFFSPFSVAAALSLVLAGAGGETQKQLIDGLRIGQSEDDFHGAMGELLRTLGMVDGTGAAKGVQVSIANNLWVAADVRLKQAYTELALARYGASAQPANFHAAPEAERDRINKHIASVTHDLIRDLLPSGSITTDTIAVITNAIYFKGVWTRTFDKAQTQPGPFVGVDGKEIADVPFMHRDMEVRYKHTGDYQAIELPYGPAADQRLSMVVMLPEERTPAALTAAVESLNGRGFAGLVDQLFETKVQIWLPRFSLEERLPLNDVLMSLGMRNMFGQADFSRMTDNAVRVSEVLHKAVVKVNEEGTEAAAATAVVMKRSAGLARPTPQFRADHPFVFFIWDRSTRTVLFIGQCVAPTVLAVS